MPTKKKVTIHASKKTSPVHAPETKVSQPKQDRPVMQVVQVSEESPELVKENVQSEASAPEIDSKTTPVGPVTPPSDVKETPVVAVEPEKPVVTVPETVPSGEIPVTASPVTSVSASTQTPATPAASSAETFSEELPPVRSSKGGLIIVLVLVLLIVCGAVGGYIYLKGGLKLPSLSSISTWLPLKKSSVNNTTTVTPTRVVTPTPTPVAVDKTKYTIKVLNGSGVPGGAAKLKESLTTDGYTVSSTGNASTSDYTNTEISAKVAVDAAFISALRTELSKSYVVSSNLVALPAQAATDIIVTIGSQTAQ